jgi:hypothetical protein
VFYTVIFFLIFPLYTYVCILSRDKIIQYYGLLQSRLLCLFYTEDMFMIIQMRKNVKKKVIALCDKFSPTMFEDRILQRGSSNVNKSSTAESTSKYEHEIEMNTAFESLKEIGV